MYQQLGPSCFASLGAFILLSPFVAFITSKLMKLQEVMMEFKDKRTKLMNEILNGIKIIKCFAWEDSFINKVGEVREGEINVIKNSIIYRSFSAFVWVRSVFSRMHFKQKKI